jgi:hypothetical protein
MALRPACSSSFDASGASIHDVNLFHTAALALPIAASSISLLNIKHHVLEILDLHDSNYASWSFLFELTFRKLGLMDHVDGSVDAQTRLLDVEWTQLDHCIISWIYLPVSKTTQQAVYALRISTTCNKKISPFTTIAAASSASPTHSLMSATPSLTGTSSSTRCAGSAPSSPMCSASSTP